MNNNNNTIVFKLPNDWKTKLHKLCISISEKEQRNVSLTELILKALEKEYNLK